MLTITLFEPQIPPNTGNIARLCGANNVKLDLVGNLGFDMEDKYLKRAGLDYWSFINWEYFPDTKEYCNNAFDNNFHLLTTKSDRLYTDRVYMDNDYLEVRPRAFQSLYYPLIQNIPAQYQCKIKIYVV